jgi:RNA-binding protein
MSLTPQDKKRFRSIGHGLKPIVTVAEKGITENIKSELNRALNDHELIKVKIAVESRESKNLLIKEIQSAVSAQCIQQIGHILLLFRAAKKPDPRLSNLLRNKLAR